MSEPAAEPFSNVPEIYEDDLDVPVRCYIQHNIAFQMTLSSDGNKDMVTLDCTSFQAQLLR